MKKEIKKIWIFTILLFFIFLNLGIVQSANIPTRITPTEPLIDRLDQQGQVVFVYPKVINGSIRFALNTGEVPIVKGFVNFTLEGEIPWKGDFGRAPNGLQYRYVLYTPSATIPLSGILEWDVTKNETFAWNSASVPDGTYFIVAEMFASVFEQDRYRQMPETIIIDNIPGAVQGEQILPVTGKAGHRVRWYESTGVDWINFSGIVEKNIVHPYPYNFFGAPVTDAGRQSLIPENAWFAEPWINQLERRYDMENGFFRTKEGHIFTGSGSYYGATDPKYYSRFIFRDGGRDEAITNPHTSYRPIPNGPGFIGIQLNGRLLKIDPTQDNIVKTLAGPVGKEGIVPYSSADDSVNNTERMTQNEIRGTFENNILFKLNSGCNSFTCIDLAIDSRDKKLVYIADEGNQRVALVNFSKCDDNYENCAVGFPYISTYAGIVGGVGLVDGNRLSAKFNRPTSLEIIGNILYVADIGNSAIRSINLDTGIVGNVGSVPGAAWWIRRDSNGNLIFINSTYILQRYHLDTGVSDYISRQMLVSFDVDWRGNVGPVDDILMARGCDPQAGCDDHGIRRVSADGSRVPLRYILHNPPYIYGTFIIEGEGDGYPITVVIDDEEARFAFTSTYRSGLVVMRPRNSSDPVDFDMAWLNRGANIYVYGGIIQWHPNIYRSSLSAVHGRAGYIRYGNQLGFDDIAEWPKSQRLAYYQNGMGTSMPRPELTGDDLEALDYFVMANSLKAKLEPIPVPIANADKTAPVMSDLNVADLDGGNINISWKTNENSIGVIAYGMDSYYGLFSEIESGYGLSHSIILPSLPSGREIHYAVISKDVAGNQAWSTDQITIIGELICVDKDGDGYNVTGGGCGIIDCNDNNAAIYQTKSCNYNGASCGNYQLCVEGCPVPPIEICGGGDNDCDGAIDEGLSCGNIPAAPSNLIANLVNGVVYLSWTDNSNNENEFIIEKSLDRNTWTEVGRVGANVTSWEDNGTLLGPGEKNIFEKILDVLGNIFRKITGYFVKN